MADGVRHLVIDGSNIATEGRSLPSLAQLDEAVRELVKERPFETWTVVVDATFGHRIDASEKQTFEEALAANELVTPPAGTIGRGDKFLLEIANRSNATVFSNDSFQEFHGEYDWLFDEGRLIGGKPVPEVGWIFTERTPVRGPKSRMATRGTDRRGRLSAPGRSAGTRRVLSATGPLPVPTKPPPRPARGEPVRAARVATVPEPASERVEVQREEATSRRRSPSFSSSSSAETVNEPLPFIEFIAEHGLGQQVQGEVLSFTSHGAFVQVGAVRCYLALKFMGDPAPRSARDVLNRGDVISFVVQAIDAPRRGIDLALPGFEDLDEDRAPIRVSASTDEPASEAPPRRSRARAVAGSSGGGDEPPTVTPGTPPVSTTSVGDRPSRARRSRTVAPASDPAPAVVVSASGADGERVEEATPAPAPARKRASRKRAAGSTTARERAATKTTPAAPAVAAVSGEVAPAEAAVGEDAPALETPSKKAPARRVAAARAATARRTATKRAAAAPAAPTPTGSAAEVGPAGGAPAKKAAAKNAPAKKAPAKKAAAKKAPAKKAPTKKAAAKNAVAKKAVAKKAATTKAPAKKAPAKKVAATTDATKKSPAKKRTAAKKASVPKAPGTKAPAKRTSSPIPPVTDDTATPATDTTPMPPTLATHLPEPQAEDV